MALQWQVNEIFWDAMMDCFEVSREMNNGGDGRVGIKTETRFGCSAKRISRGHMTRLGAERR